MLHREFNPSPQGVSVTLDATALLAPWREVLMCSTIDQEKIRKALALHLQRCDLPSRECVFHLSPKSLVDPQTHHAPSEEAYQTALRWHDWWDQACSVAWDALEDTDWGVGSRITQHESAGLPHGTLGAIEVAASDIIWQYSGDFDESMNPWHPLIRAFGAGALLLWIEEEAVHILLCPEIHLDKQKRPHCECGPALRWQDGTSLYFCHGIRVPQEFVAHREKLAPAERLAFYVALYLQNLVEECGSEALQDVIKVSTQRAKSSQEDHASLATIEIYDSSPYGKATYRLSTFPCSLNPIDWYRSLEPRESIANRLMALWRGAFSFDTTIDRAAIQRGFDRHLQCLGLPRRGYVFHESPTNMMQQLRLPQISQADQAWQFIDNTLSWTLSSEHVLVATQNGFEEVSYESEWHQLYLLTLAIIPAFDAHTTLVNDTIWECDLSYASDWNPWRSLRQAFQAGAFFYRVTEEAVHVLLRPEIHRDDQGRFHSETGPAVRWADGSGFYFWHGVRVPEQVILRPRTLKPRQILKERSVAVRRIMIERFGGIGRLVTEVGRRIDQSHWGTLYWLEIPDEPEPVVMVKVLCPSTWRNFLLRVPPTTTTVQEAVAWTFGLSAESYKPMYQT